MAATLSGLSVAWSCQPVNGSRLARSGKTWKPCLARAIAACFLVKRLAPEVVLFDATKRLRTPELRQYPICVEHIEMAGRVAFHPHSIQISSFLAIQAVFVDHFEGVQKNAFMLHYNIKNDDRQ